jgi:FlaA1/EpsC-like NDP-sugar epimerase
VLKYGCEKLIIYDIDENALFEINEELKQVYSPNRYRLTLGSVRDEKRLDFVFRMYGPQIVFHAAAHKHVPMMEINAGEAIKNNIFGTKNVIDACKKYAVSKFILISTDKAVNPTSIMGATKRAAELLVQAESTTKTEMAAVRFGNVLGSSGSVIPTFRRQIQNGGPVTVTDPEMRRYFMTIEEAVSLVLHAATQAHGGEIFVLDMGEPVKIYDLACDLIRLSGSAPEKDIKIVITGFRPEKSCLKRSNWILKRWTRPAMRKSLSCTPRGLIRSGCTQG